MDTFKCICGFEAEDGRKVNGHILAWKRKEPGKHEKILGVSAAVVVPEATIDIPAPVVPEKPCPDCVIAQRNLEQRAEIDAEYEAYLDSCPGCGVVAALVEEETDVLGRVHARFEQASPPTEVAGDTTQQILTKAKQLIRERKAELPGPAVSDGEKPNRTGIYIVVSALAFVAFVVLVILKVRGVIAG